MDTVFDQSAAAVLRWMGKAGFSVQEAGKVIRAKGVKAAPGTVRNMVRRGARGVKGEPAKLTAVQQAELKKLREKYRDVEGPSKPKPPKGDGPKGGKKKTAAKKSGASKPPAKPKAEKKNGNGNGSKQKVAAEAAEQEASPRARRDDPANAKWTERLASMDERTAFWKKNPTQCAYVRDYGDGTGKLCGGSRIANSNACEWHAAKYDREALLAEAEAARESKAAALAVSK